MGSRFGIGDEGEGGRRRVQISVVLDTLLEFFSLILRIALRNVVHNGCFEKRIVRDERGVRGLESWLSGIVSWVSRVRYVEI